MAETTHIEWTDATWNIVTGCSVVSPGCTNCYAMKLAGTRLQHHPSRAGLTTPSKAGPVWNGQVRFNADWLTQPLHWTRPRMIFVAAHSDLFHEGVTDGQLDQIFEVMALAHWHTFQILTKRPERMRDYLAPLLPDGVSRARRTLNAGDGPTDPRFVSWPLPNVWLGVSVEDQARANERVPILLDTPAVVRWISAEPLLGAVNLTRVRIGEPTAQLGTPHIDALSGYWRGLEDCPAAHRKVDWVVAGGEGGPGARPMHPDWARQLRNQCADADVPFLFKQWGAWGPDDGPPADGPDRIFDGRAPCAKWTGDGWAHASDGYAMPIERTDRGAWVYRLGKKATGRLLDGVQHDGFPGARP